MLSRCRASCDVLAQINEFDFLASPWPYISLTKLLPWGCSKLPALQDDGKEKNPTNAEKLSGSRSRNRAYPKYLEFCQILSRRIDEAPVSRLIDRMEVRVQEES